MKMGIRLKVLIPVLIFIIIVLPACSQEEDLSGQGNIIAVKTAEVKKENISVPLHTSGKVTSSSETKLSFKTGGVIQKIFKDEGTRAAKGELLAKLDLSEINSRVTQALEGFEKARRDLARIEKLYRDSVVTLEQLQNMQTAFEVAKSELQIAEFNKNHSTIIAPANGIILKRFNEEGEITAPGNPVFLYGSNNTNWIVKAGITDKDIINITLGDSASVKVDAYPGRVFRGFVTEIGASANPYTGTYEVELTLDESEQKLSSGFVAVADIFVNTGEIQTTIPVEALFEAHGSEAYIFTYDQQKMQAEKKGIKILRILAEKIIVESGLESTEVVITDGVEYLSNGQKIMIK